MSDADEQPQPNRRESQRRRSSNSLPRQEHPSQAPTTTTAATATAATKKATRSGCTAGSASLRPSQGASKQAMSKQAKARPTTAERMIAQPRCSHQYLDTDQVPPTVDDIADSRIQVLEPINQIPMRLNGGSLDFVLERSFQESFVSWNRFLSLSFRW